MSVTVCVRASERTSGTRVCGGTTVCATRRLQSCLDDNAHAGTKAVTAPQEGDLVWLPIDQTF